MYQQALLTRIYLVQFRSVSSEQPILATTNVIGGYRETCLLEPRSSRGLDYQANALGFASLWLHPQE